MKVKVTVTAREASFSKRKIFITDVEKSLEIVNSTYQEYVKTLPYFTSLEVTIVPLRPKELEIYHIASGS